MNAEQNSRLEILAYKIWEEQGRPEGRQEENWAEAERRLRFEPDGSSVSDSPRLPDALSLKGREMQDTPARANPANSRQQSGPESDSKSGSPGRVRQR